MLSDSLVVILGVLGIFILWFSFRNRERQRDLNADYSNIQGNIIRQSDGEIWFVFPYTKNEPRKQQAIFEQYRQGTLVISESGFEYVVSNLLYKDYYEGTGASKEGPYIVFKLISKIEYQRYGNYFNGPTQFISGDNYGTLNQISYCEEIEFFRNEMEARGVHPKDIDVLQRYPEDRDIQEKFLSEYEPILRGIEVVSAGVTLFELLYRIFFGGS